MSTDDNHLFDVRRRSFLTGIPATAAAVALGSVTASAQTGQVAASVAPGRRLLGGLEVSEIGLGVQNMHRTFHTVVPDRDDMISLIRTA